MPSYKYRAINGRGRTVKGELAATTQATLGRLLQEKGLLLVDVTEHEEEGLQSGSRFGNRSALLSFTRTLSTLLGAGLTLSRSLSAAQHTARGGMINIVQAVRARVDRGDNVSEALAEQSSFSTLYVGMVRAGERSGDLPGAFRRLSDHLEREAEFRARLLSALIYPLILLVAGSSAIVLLLLFVLPRFAEILEGAGAALPRSTAIVLWVGDVFRQAWPVLPVIGIAVLVLAAWAETSPNGRETLSRLLLRGPLGALRRQALTARFARVLGILLGGGAFMMAALDDTAQSMSDAVARAEVDRVRTQVREGKTLHSSVREGPFSPLLFDMVAVGEESGRLEDLLLKTAEILDREVERTVQRVTALLEPVMIVVFGAVVGVIALSLLQAVYGVNAAAFR